MILSAIGDSLTEGDYGIKGKRGIANVHRENYPYFLSQMTGFEVRNFGKCGYTATSYLKYYLGGNVNIVGSDIILVMLGTNGGFDPDTETQGNADFGTLLKKLHADEPKARIVIVTPPHCTENPAYSNCGYAGRVAGAVAFLRSFAAREGYELLDLAASGLFTAENEAVMQPNDGLHFGEEGYKTLANFFADSLFRYAENEEENTESL